MKEILLPEIIQNMRSETSQNLKIFKTILLMKEIISLEILQNRRNLTIFKIIFPYK